jgi:hypothetical protein
MKKLIAIASVCLMAIAINAFASTADLLSPPFEVFAPDIQTVTGFAPIPDVSNAPVAEVAARREPCSGPACSAAMTAGLAQIAVLHGFGGAMVRNDAGG